MLGRRPEVEWERLGGSNPYWGVLSNPEYDGDLSVEARETFFRSGREDVAQALDDVVRLYPDWEPHTCIDYGCGVGRISLALAARAAHVHGLDISAAMLRTAAANAGAAAVDNVDWRLAGELAELSGTYDFAYSRIVFQHIPVRTGEAIFTDLVLGLQPGGVGHIHVAVGSPSARARMYGPVVSSVPLAADMWNVVRRRPRRSPTIQMYSYRIERLGQILAANGILTWSVRFTPAPHRRDFHGAALIFRKP